MTKLKAAAKAAYESFYFQNDFRWEDAGPETQKVWLALTLAAIEAYND